MTAIAYATSDNAEGQLSAGISGSSTTITVLSGEGAEFPQPLTGTSSSQGDSTTLNDTGALGSLSVGDFIRNLTDGSWAFVTVLTSANSVKTTRLRGGTANIWDNAEEWQVNEFVITLEKRDGNGDVTQREKVLIKNRSTDDLTVRTRGYDGGAGQSFLANDYVNLHVTSVIIEDLIDVLGDLAVTVNTNQTTQETNDTTHDTDIANLKDGGEFWLTSVSGTDTITAVAATTLSAYVDGMMFNFSAAGAVTGAATLNIDGVGARAIKKFTGGSEEDPANNDIVTNQVVTVVFDSALDSASGAWVIVSPKAQELSAQLESLKVTTSDGGAVGASSTADNTLDDNFDIGANSLAVGDVIRLDFSGEYRIDLGRLALRLKLDTVVLGIFRSWGSVTPGKLYSFSGYTVFTVRSIGGSGTVIAAGGVLAGQNTNELVVLEDANDDDTPVAQATVNTTQVLTLQLSAQFDNSDAQHTIKLHQFIVTKINAP